MLITVPDCHPKTPKNKEYGNGTYIMSSRNQHDNTQHFFRSFIDRRVEQVSCFSSHNLNQVSETMLQVNSSLST